MEWFLGTVIGFIIGSELFLGALPGAAIGSAIGFLLGKINQLSKQSVGLQRELTELKQRVSTLLKQDEDTQPEGSHVKQESPEKQTAAPPPQPAIKAVEVPEAEALVSPPVDHRQEETKLATDETTAAAEDAPLQSAQADSQPSFADTLAKNSNAAVDYVKSLVGKVNVVTRVGIVVLFFGVAFLLKYTVENFSVPIEARLLAVAAGAAALLFFGWRLREKRQDYAVLIQGAAVGLLYLVTYTALSLYQLLPMSAGFPLMLLISLFTVFLALKQDAKGLAMFAILGGFLAPILTSTGSGSHVMLFGYYAILNVGIVLITWFKSWRYLPLMGFVFTFLIGAAWGATQYRPEHFASTEPFLILFMLFYIAVVLMFALRKRWQHAPVFDGLLVFGPPAIGMGLQSQLVQHTQYGMAWSALGFGLCYLAIVKYWNKALTEQSPLLKECFLAIGLVLVSLAVPYAFDADLTALIWTLEGLGGFWLAVRQQRYWASLLALLVQLGAGLFWLLGWIFDASPSGEYLFANLAYFNAALIALAGLYSAWLLQAQPSSFRLRSCHWPILAWGLLWWYAAAAWQLESHLDQSYLPAAALLFISASALLLQGVRRRFNWQAVLPMILALLPMMLLLAMSTIAIVQRPSQSLGFLAWPIAILSLYWLYNKTDIFQGKVSQQEASSHATAFLLAVALLSWEIVARINALNWEVISGIQGTTGIHSWPLIGGGIPALAAAWLITKVRFWRIELDTVYRQVVSAILYAGLLINVLICCLIKPDISPLNYWPLLNPLDLWQIAVIASAALWWMKTSNKIPDPLYANAGWWLLAAISFIYVNTLLLRIIHITSGIPFDLNILMQADIVQTALSILWTTIGVALFAATKYWQKRALWLVGVGLFAVVVIKLFAVDLANSGTVARIVSFIAVGVLLLAVGYLVPIPDKEEEAEAEAEA
ncbi:putative membrane protein [Sinobacterium caligoides]|uniref:Putative membrane protein n=1 Tax=Sinobacterium caligoides TaxID=933926 RepID=A0A3N2D591_9GAMM|nr:DUF2339 domain-containing protein [Sinobacterium caligoides]ROR94940.1 putative membrane protein [Sinobacterium caligoides]